MSGPKSYDAPMVIANTWFIRKRALAMSFTSGSIALGGTLGSYTVSVLAGDGTISTRSVSTGLVTTDLAEITSGLAGGERVVTEGAYGVEDSVKVSQAK